MSEENLPITEDQVKHEQELSGDAKEDYDLARDVYRDMLDKGKNALESMADLAEDSEHPRAYEVLNNMVKTVADVADKLMELQKSKNDVLSRRGGSQVPPAEGGSTTNTIVFAGTTEELQRRLHEAAENSTMKDITPMEVKE